MFGGPFGAVFGGMIGSTMGKMMSGISKKVWPWIGSIVGVGTGFLWNTSGFNNLKDNQKRQLPGFMCLLPKDKLEIYLKALFHMGAWVIGQDSTGIDHTSTISLIDEHARLLPGYTSPNSDDRDPRINFQGIWIYYRGLLV
jgi:hypothetical protein